MGLYKYDSELYHYGRKGMKWGQSIYGSLRRGASKAKRSISDYGTKRKDRAAAKKQAKAQNNIKSKSIKNLTDDELRQRINRMSLEKQAYLLEKDISSLNPKKVSAGKKFVRSVGKNVLAPAATEAGKRLLTDKLIDVGKKRLGLNNLDDGISGLKKEVEQLRLKKEKAVINDYFDKRSKKQEQKSSNKNEKSESKTKESSKEKSSNKVYEGEAVGEGRSKRSSNRKDNVVDADWSYVSANQARNSNQKQLGQQYVYGLLEDPKKRR